MTNKLTPEEKKYRNEIKKISKLLQLREGVATPLKFADSLSEYFANFSYKREYAKILKAPMVKKLKSYKPIPIE